MIFIGMASTVIPVVMGRLPRDLEKTPYRDTVHTALPPAVLMGLVLMLGLWIPAPLQSLLQEAAELLGGGR